jgi:hypothetical protein
MRFVTIPILSAISFAAPSFLLPDDVIPKRHIIEMTIDPNKDTFDGWARIGVELRKPISIIWVNAKDVTPKEASIEIGGRTAIVVDDGIATGATMRVALRAVRRRGPALLVLAAPVAAAETLASLAGEADETVCVEAPEGLGAIGYYYEDFHQLSDAEVTGLLARSADGGTTP